MTATFMATKAIYPVYQLMKDQGVKFDPNGDYVRKYIPELRHTRGGEVAKSLADLYDWTRRLIIASSGKDGVEKLKTARKALGEISEAWSSIANRIG